MTQTTSAPALHLTADHLTADTIEYLGKISAWLRTAPSGCVPYGEFRIELVRISLDGVATIGSFEPDSLGGFFAFTPRRAVPVDEPTPATVHRHGGGRPSRLTPDQVALAKRMRASGETILTLSRTFGVSRATVYRALGTVGS